MHREARVTHRVLIVDDNLDNVLSSGVLLQMAGHEVCTAFDGLQALKVAELYSPRVILLDIGLPGLCGYDVAERIRTAPWGTHMVLVAVTGMSGSDVSEKCIRAGFHFNFVKPVAPQELTLLLSHIPAKVRPLPPLNCQVLVPEFTPSAPVDSPQH